MLLLHDEHYVVKQGDRFNIESWCDLKIYGNNENLVVIITEPISETGHFMCHNPVNERLTPIALALWMSGYRFTHFIYYVPSYGLDSTANLATLAERNQKAFFMHSEKLFHFNFEIVGEELVARCVGEAILEHVEVLTGVAWCDWHTANNHTQYIQWSD